MKAYAEQLPIEIWLMIFRYLEMDDLFHGFHCLNSYFDQILASDHLSFYVRLKETDNHHLQYSKASYWSDSVLNRIICLRSSVQSRSNYLFQFLHLHVNLLNRLQSLSIKISRQDTLYPSSNFEVLQKLHGLKYLSLVCTLNQHIFESILAISTLRICRLILRELTETMNYHSDVQSNIKQLFVVFLNNVNNSVIDLFLLHMPKLQRLEISGPYFSFDQVSIFDKQLFTLPELRILKLQLANACFLSDCFKCLHSIIPVLKYFYFNYTKHVLPETFLDIFNSYWWPIIEQIQYINIYIKGHVMIDTTNNNTHINLQKNQQILLARNRQFNKSFKIEWNEQDFKRFRSIEITIIKS